MRSSVLVATAVAVATAVGVLTGGSALAAPAPPAPPRPSAASGGTGNHVVALGDSWAAGSAAGSVDTTTGPCRRSPHAYPPRVAIGTGQTHWISRACASAARTTDAPVDPVGALPDAAVPGHALPTPTTSLAGDGPERADTQFDVIDANTQAVTATVGADAIGLGATARACSGAGSPTSCDEAARRADHALDGLPRSLDTSLADLRRRAPRAAIVLADYPLLTEGTACAAGAADVPRANRLDGLVTRLDTLLHDRGVAAGARVVDVRAAFRGHGTCAPDPWLTPLTAPDALLAGAPTAAGQQRGYAAPITSALRAAVPARPTAPVTGHPTTPTKPTKPSAPTKPAPTAPAPPLRLPDLPALPILSDRPLDGRTAVDDGLLQPLFTG